MKITHITGEKLLILYLLSTISFFLPIPEGISKLLQYFLLLSMFIYTYKFKKNIIYNEKYCKYFNWFCLSIIFSIFPAYYYWNQSIYVSTVAILAFFGYFLYFLCVKLSIDKSVLLNAIVVISNIHILLTLIKLIYPNFPIGNIIEDGNRESRILLITELYNIFYFFKSIDDYIKYKQKKYLTISICCFICILLTGTRQRMLAAVVIAIIFILRRTNVRKRIQVIILCIISTLFLIRTSYVSNMISMTTQQLQSDNPHDAIRTIGITYYLTEFPEKGLNKYIGNGIPSYSRSEYGKNSKEFADSTLIHLVDIGLIGIYNYFGLIGVLFLLLIFYKFLKIKNTSNYSYCKYVLLFLFSNSITSGVLLFPSQIPLICICAYFITPIKTKYHGCFNNYSKL